MVRSNAKFKTIGRRKRDRHVGGPSNRSRGGSYEKMMKTLLLQNQQIIIQQQNMMFMVMKQYQPAGSQQAASPSGPIDISSSTTTQSGRPNSPIPNTNLISAGTPIPSSSQDPAGVLAATASNLHQLVHHQHQQPQQHQHQQPLQQQHQNEHQDQQLQQIQTQQHHIIHHGDHSIQSHHLFSQSSSQQTTSHQDSQQQQHNQVDQQQMQENLCNYLTPAASEQDPIRSEDDELAALLDGDGLLHNNVLYNPQTDIGSVTPYKSHQQQQQTPSYYSSGCESLTTPRVEQQRQPTTTNISQNVVKNLADSFKSPTKPKINVQILSNSSTGSMKNSKAKIIQRMNISEFLRHVHPEAPSSNQKSTAH